MSTLLEQYAAEINNAITMTLRATTYRLTYFIRMVETRGALDASLSLIRSTKESEGFTKLWELNRLDLTVEAIALRPKFADLFSSDDVLKAKIRLERYNFIFFPKGT
jgi:hypothetical protein